MHVVPSEPRIGRIAVAVAVVLLAGCAARYTHAPLTADHPASPDSAATALPERSHTLTVGEQPAPATPGADNSGAHDGAHPGIAEGVEAGTMPAHQHDAATAPAGDAAATLYVCPMHPDVTSDKPDQRCPTCGMKLVEQTDGGRDP
jgi:hypothetical protein